MQIPILWLLPALAVLVLQCALLWRLAQARRGEAQALDARLQQLERASQATQMAAARSDGALAQIQQQLHGHWQQSQSGAQAARQEQGEALAALRQDLARLSAQLAADSAQTRASLNAGAQQLSEHVQQRFEALAHGLRATLDSAKNDIQQQLTHTSTTAAAALQAQLGSHGEQLQHQFSSLQETLARQLAAMVQSGQSTSEQLRATLNERLASIQSDNAAKLEQMRCTVDEKLHATLEQRLGESFKLVSDRLEQVQKGLGEMQTLAGSVGDLKRIMSNVKTRGTWGEWQLGAIIEDLLTPEQYARNVKPVPGSDEMVEFAIRLPGRGAPEEPLWLPIDAKYPTEPYQRLLDAHESADKAAIEAAGNAFETSIKLEAKKIASKYIHPPHTTEFAVLYLPTEGLFAETVRRRGLLEAVQNGCRVMIAGPTNLAAMLSSLQMGFKTLAIEKRSSEVWTVLGQVKSEFKKFGEAVDKTRKSLDAATRSLDPISVRTRAIERKLRHVQELPAAQLDMQESDGTDMDEAAQPQPEHAA